EAGCSKGWGGSMHLVDVEKGVMGSSSILGGTIPHAVGCALAFQIKEESKVAVSVFGDAAIEEGVFHESLNWASLKKLPVIFVCENNLYSTSTSLKDRQPQVEIFKRAESYGMPGIRVDGNDVVKVYEVASEAMANAREGKGPTLIEAMTYRWREHVGPNYDYDLGYRTKSELDEWMAKCPVKKYTHLLSQEENESLIKGYEKEIDEAIEFARQSPFPREELMANEVL
ncbi:MAG: thiamine pyrophosphate-dependent dehydrogenase E1 component subunit alpha, partial [Candidatus Omnitrophica bacterium]|nr:thiamine pyrophosphate-dependent dehydrogenase E1 component subunit alpha [Candidatus Omnitrophota bacterium]